MSTFDRISSIITLHFGETVDSASDDLVSDLKLDSLDAVELFMAVEEEFDISVDDDIARAWLTVGDVVKYVDAALADKALSAAQA